MGRGECKSWIGVVSAFLTPGTRAVRMIRIIANAAEPSALGPSAQAGLSVQAMRATPPKKRRALRLDVASLDTLEDAALAMDESGYITYCNLAAEQLYRIDRAAMLGRPYR